MAKQSREFEKRKGDHLKIALDFRSQSLSQDFSHINLKHEALVDFNLNDVTLETEVFKKKYSVPFFISSMTAGHRRGVKVNESLARLSHEKQILMGVGSQRRELFDQNSSREWSVLRKKYPRARLAGNLGLAQLIEYPTLRCLELIERLEAEALFIHLNPLQECIQSEGTPQFSGAISALESLIRQSPVPVIIKETGCGMSQETIQRLNDLGAAAIDVSGRGGTHWGRVEKLRMSTKKQKKWEAFNDWGLTTVQSLLNAQNVQLKSLIFASGGIRSGVDIVKSMALGAEMVGLAQPWLVAASQKNPHSALLELYQDLVDQIKVSLFCIGVKTPVELKRKKVILWQNQ